MRQFCTSFDSAGRFKGLAFYHSLTRRAPGSVLWVLCFDKATERVLGSRPLPGFRVLALAELEQAEPRLRTGKADRSRVNYNFACTPALLWHLLTRVPAAAPITYLDADLYFFSNPAPVLKESAAGSNTIIPHRFPPTYKHIEECGLYHVSWLTFMDGRAGRECLAWWLNRCIEGCYDRLEVGKIADQKYLDDWATHFENVHVLAHDGARVVPWNVAAHPVSHGAGGLRAGKAPLVFYQFRGFVR